MKLVDLRFVERSVPAPEIGPNVGRMVKVLQMRHKELRIEPVDGAVHISGHDCKESYQWGQWEDVPCVGAGD